VEQLLGEELLPPEPGQAATETGLRHRFLGDFPGQPLDALLVEACNRLASRTSGQAVLAFEAIDAADDVTIDTLVQILKRPGWLRLPLLVTARGTPQGLVAELIYLLCHEDGDTAVVEVAGDTAPSETAAAFAWAELPPDVLRVLRAGSLLGTTFAADVIARLLDEPLGVVLEKLQWAADAGTPLADRGEGRFSLPPALITALQQSMLPSLLTFWHARLGDILRGGQPAGGAVGLAQPRDGMPRHEPRSAPREQQSAPSAEVFDRPQMRPEADTPAQRPFARYAELFEPAPSSVVPEATPLPQTAQQEATRAPGVNPAERQRFGASQRAGKTASSAPLPGDQPRAAAHLQAAGQTEAAVEQYLAGVQEVAARGDARRAYGLTEQALQLLDTLPSSNQRALLRAQILLERGRLQWQGALLGSPFTLQEALASLEAAESSLPHDAPLGVVGQLAAVTAGVCYDLGDLPALQRALETLTEHSRRLFNAGDALLATRLLNDQAAVYIRLGDPVRAAHLLTQSRELFESHVRNNPNDIMAAEELAETDHLFARLLLHAQRRPGREAEASALGLEHARAAERAYQRLGQRHKLARVWETMGRLELQRGQLQAAQERLTAALNLQQQLGDVTGLARSTAALADLCVRTDRLSDALALLTDSITLNFEKGSPLGLAFNRRALDALANTVAQTHGPGADNVRSALTEVESRLAQAESVFGRLVLPGEAG
jgi:tetratricopeptide (TPR) repeat protein